MLSVSSQGLEWHANEFDPTHVDPPPAPRLTRLRRAPVPQELAPGGSTIAGTATRGVHPTSATSTTPDPHCLYHDGFAISPGPGLGPLHGAGGYFTGTSGARVAFVINGDHLNPLGGGSLFVGGYQFFGVIDAGPAGLTELQFRETDGKVGQQLLIFGDDFTVVGTQPPTPVSALDERGLVGLGVLLALTAIWLSRPFSGSRLTRNSRRTRSATFTPESAAWWVPQP